MAAYARMIYRRTQSDSEEEINYLASVSDAVAGLLFVFMLVLVTFSIQFNEARVVERRLAREQARVIRELTALDEIRRNMLREIEQALKEQGIRVHIDFDNGVVRLPEAILFPSGSADLTPGGAQALRKLARALFAVVPCYTSRPEAVGMSRCPAETRGKLDAVFIEGHTDDVPIHTERYPDNWALSAARAIRTYQALMAIEPDLEELRNRKGQPVFTVSGYADRRPVAPNVTPEGRQLNRRIDLRFVMVSPERPVGWMQEQEVEPGGGQRR